VDSRPSARCSTRLVRHVRRVAAVLRVVPARRGVARLAKWARREVGARASAVAEHRDRVQAFRVLGERRARGGPSSGARDRSQARTGRAGGSRAPPERPRPRDRRDRRTARDLAEDGPGLPQGWVVPGVRRPGHHGGAMPALCGSPRQAAAVDPPGGGSRHPRLGAGGGAGADERRLDPGGGPDAKVGTGVPALAEQRDGQDAVRELEAGLARRRVPVPPPALESRHGRGRTSRVRGGQRTGPDPGRPRALRRATVAGDRPVTSRFAPDGARSRGPGCPAPPVDARSHRDSDGASRAGARPAAGVSRLEPLEARASSRDHGPPALRELVSRHIGGQGTIAG
jgi:hypothetical protein